MTSNNIKVCIKIRPLIQREKNENLPSLWSLVDDNTIKSHNKEYKLSFDHIFDEQRTTEDLFNTVARPIVENAVKGINGTIFAYGQTSSGKTYCMMGTEDEPGIIPLTVQEIFKQIEFSKDREFLIRVGYIEIYNEKIFDLLVDNKAEITKVHETKSGEVVVDQTEIVSASVQSILDNYDKGNKGRRVGETCMNERSSRSHTIFRIVIESHENGSKDGVFQVSTLNLVDLAGSERVDQTKATGERLREGGHINKSLLSLSKVIRELGDLNDNKEKNIETIKYINYRDSKLTRILSASLGGNAMTSIICTITPVALEETYSTLTFASNAKKIKNQPKVNETISDKVIMIRLQKEIAALKDELDEERSKNSEMPKIQQIISKIFDRESQIIHSHCDNVAKAAEINRRRTWMCPSSSSEKGSELSQPMIKNNNIMPPPPPFILKKELISPNSEVTFSPADDFANEIFQSPDKAQFDMQFMESPGRRISPMKFNMKSSQFRTPRSLKPIIEVDSPYVGKLSGDNENKILKERIKYLENELEELQDFKLLEEKISTTSDETTKILEENMEALRQQLLHSQNKVDMLENDMTEKMIEIENLKSLKKKCESMEVDYKKAMQEREKAENLVSSIQYEYEQAQIKFKNREKELIQCLNEARSESNEAESIQKEKIKSLQQILLKTEEDLFALESQKAAQNEKKIDSKNMHNYLEKNIKELENKLELALKEREKAENSLKEKNNEIETLSDQLVEAVQDTDSLQEKIQKLEETLKSKDTELADMATKLSELEEISNRYQKICQTVTVNETFSEICYDENDEVCKFIVRLQQSATKTELLESENKQLLNQIAENNLINEEVEELKKKICDLEQLIKCKDSDNEKLSSQLSEHEFISNRLQKIQNMLQNDDQALNGDESDDLCQLINKLHQDSNKVELLKAEKLQLLNQINDNNSVNSGIEELHNKIAELEENIKLRDSQKDAIQSQLNDLQAIAVKFQNIQQYIQNNDLDSDENDEVIKLIESLHAKANENDLLKVQNEQLMTQINQIDIDNGNLEKLQVKITELEELINLKESELQKQQFEYVDSTSKLERISEVLQNSQLIDDDCDDICEVIIKLSQNSEKSNQFESNKSQIDENKSQVEQLQNKVTEFEELIKVKETEMENLLLKLSECNKVVDQFSKIQEILVSNDTMGDDVCEIIERLCENVVKVKDLQTEKESLLKQISEFNCTSAKAEEMEQKINELSDIIKCKEVEKDNLMTKLADHEQTIGQIQKIQEILAADGIISEDQLDENDEITKMVVQLRLKAENAESLKVENLKLLDDIAANQQECQKANELKEQVINLKESIDLKENEKMELTSKLSESKEMIEKYEKIEKALANNEIISENCFDETDNFGKLIVKLHQNASRTESLENEKHQLLNEIAEIRRDAEILTEKLLANQTLSETEFQLRERIDSLEAELAETKVRFEEQMFRYNDIESSQLDLQIKVEEIQKEKEQLESQITELKSITGSKTNEYNALEVQLNGNLLKIHEYECEISQLTSKVEELNCKNDKLTKANADYNNQLSKLDAELTNSLSQLVIKEEEFKCLKKEINQIKEQLKLKTIECDELKTRYRRRSEDNERKLNELELANTKLIQEVGATEAMKISAENDLKKLKDEHARVLNKFKSLEEINNDNDMKYAILDEKYSQLCTVNMQLEKKLADLNDKVKLESKNKDVVKQLEKEIVSLNEMISQQTSENDLKVKLVKDLQEKCETLLKEVEDNQFKPKKSSSPTNRRSDEKELFSAQHRLQVDNHSGTPARTLKSNIDRKSRRQSVYDERRDLSAWELTQTESTQTDPVDKMCACTELSEKIKELQIEIRLRDCKIANAQRMANVNIYKYELEDTKKELHREKRENNQLKEIMESLKGKLSNAQMKNHELEKNQRCSDVQIRAVQTDDTDLISKDEFEKVLNEKNVLEKKFSETKRQLSQEKMVSGKENLSSNTAKRLQEYPSTESDIADSPNSIRLDYDTLDSEYKKLQKKYDNAKKLCNLRMDDMTKLREELFAKNSLAELMTAKYKKAKHICETRLENIRYLREKLGENGDTKESFGDSITTTLSNKS